MNSFHRFSLFILSLSVLVAGQSNALTTFGTMQALVQDFKIQGSCRKAQEALDVALRSDLDPTKFRIRSTSDCKSADAKSVSVHYVLFFEPFTPSNLTDLETYTNKHDREKVEGSEVSFAKVETIEVELNQEAFNDKQLVTHTAAKQTLTSIASLDQLVEGARVAWVQGTIQDGLRNTYFFFGNDVYKNWFDKVLPASNYVEGTFNAGFKVNGTSYPIPVPSHVSFRRQCNGAPDSPVAEKKCL